LLLFFKKEGLPLYLSNLLIEPLVRAALLEDLGRAGDITTEACVPADAHGAGVLAARVAGTIAGLDLAAMAFRLVDARVRFVPRVQDGQAVAAGEVIADLQGPARGLLTGERVALNFLGHLSGIATATRGIADSIAHTACRVVCTRKTTPGLRAVEKYAVRCGGGRNHRFGLDDAILIKDNHIALAGGIRPALEGARERAGHLIKIEIEVDTLEQLSAVLEVGADAILLDNMNLDQLRAAVHLVAGRAVTEASGGITPARAPAVAETGVDFMSVGWLTHSVRTLDIGLDI
jgi:nicotinate-nucleotide pyrophosphorylase (carboxylating)